MPHSTNTKKQLAITTSPAIASLWKLIAILIEFSHWQILTSFRNTSNERRTHLDHRSCALCSLVLQGVLFSLQGRLKTKSQPMKALQNTVIEIIALMWSLPSGKLWQFASESLNWAWRCHFTSLPLMAAVLRYMFLLGVERSMSVGHYWGNGPPVWFGLLCVRVRRLHGSSPQSLSRRRRKVQGLTSTWLDPQTRPPHILNRFEDDVTRCCDVVTLMSSWQQK